MCHSSYFVLLVNELGTATLHLLPNHFTLFWLLIQSFFTIFEKKVILCKNEV